MKETDVFTCVVERTLHRWEPTMIADVGSADCAQSAELLTRYAQAKCVAFEANPANHGNCQVTASQHSKRLTFVPKAVCEHDGNTQFFDVPTNRGAGSIFKPSGVYDPVEKMPSIQINVPCLRLDSYLKQTNTPPFDMLWMDTQGGELGALKSLGGHISSVKAIWTEYEVIPIYSGQPLEAELFGWLCNLGFQNVYKHECVSGCFGEAIFVR